jgi:hypothetical protein
MTDSILPLGLRFRGNLIWLAGHLTPLSGFLRTRQTRGRQGSGRRQRINQ